MYKREYIENTRSESFDIKFIRQGFNKLCIIAKLCRAIICALSKPSLVKLDIKRCDPGILFISYPLVHSFNCQFRSRY